MTFSPASGEAEAETDSEDRGVQASSLLMEDQILAAVSVLTSTCKTHPGPKMLRSSRQDDAHKGLPFRLCTSQVMKKNNLDFTEIKAQ